MAGSTWTWNGGSATASSSNWTLTSGAGNSSHMPAAGDTAIVPDGTVVGGLDLQLVENTVELRGTAGIAATVISTGDASADFGKPTLDTASLLTSAVKGHTTSPETSVLDALGTFVNEGTILADGPAGSVFTIDIGATVISGTLDPGYFFNPGMIQADAGNTLVINVGAGSELFNSGSIVADGGTVVITASPSAIAGGVAAEASFFIVEGGGTLETQASYPLINGSLPGGTTPRYEFADATAGNTLKIDNLRSFSGSVIGFQAGDTVDLGASLAVGTLVYSTTTGLLVLENSAGTVLDSFYLSTDAMTSGTFVVTNGGTADGLIIGTGADGDTVVTTARTFPNASGVSGTWQSATSWNNGIVPGVLDTGFIGFGETTNFTLTTGTAAVSVAGISIFDPSATARITSDTTTLPGIVNLYAGTLEVTGGNTLTTSFLRTFDPLASVLIQAGGTVAVTGRPNSNLASIAGTLAISQGNSSAVQIAAGTLVVDGALLAGPNATTDGGSFTIGSDSAGTPASVIVNGDGTATDGQVTDTYTLLGSDPTSSGTLTLDGRAANWTDTIDPNDPLNSRGYILVGFNNLSANSGTLAQLGSLAAAQVLIENGATLTDQVGGYIGDYVNSSGTVTVETDGLWNLDYHGMGAGIGIGDGLLAVLAGGTVTIGNPLSYLSNGTTVAYGGIGVGGFIGASGTVLVEGEGSQLSTGNGIGLGQSGQGILEILNGGTVTINTAGITAGQFADAGSSGIIQVGSVGAPAALDFASTANGLTVGGASRGTLIAADNGIINLNGGAGLTIGSAAGSFGTAVVGGTTASAVINIGSAGITVGNSGAGYLTLNHLGTIAMTGTGGLGAGEAAGALGVITVDGGLLTEAASTNGVGLGGANGASASMLIENSGTVSLGGNWLTAGSAFGSSGTVTVTGAGSVLKTSGTAGVTVGYSGTGTLAVSSGGNLSVTGTGGINVGGNANGSGAITITGGTVTDGNYLTIGLASGASGTVIVSGATSRLSVAALAEVGQSGSGTLIVTGATISTGGLGVGGSTAAPTSNVSNQASLTASARIAVATALALWQGATLSLDGSSAIDVGSSGGYVAGAIDVANGHSLIGAGLVNAAAVNEGLIEALGSSASDNFTLGTLEIDGAVDGSGVLDIGTAAILRLDGPVSSGQAVNFVPNGGNELILADPGNRFDNQITGLSAGDKIEFGNGVTITSAPVVNGSTITFGYHGSTGIAETYSLTDVGYAAGANEQFTWGADGTDGFAFIQLQPATFYWTGAVDTDYGTGGNWQGGVAPTALDAADFVSGTNTTVTGTGSALSLTIGDYFAASGPTWTFLNANLTVRGAGQAFYGYAIYADTLFDGGSVTFVNGGGNIGGLVGIIVTAEDGAQISSGGDYIGYYNRYASVIVTGPTTRWTEVLESGPQQSGVLAVGPGGQLTVTDGASLVTGGFGAIVGGGNGVLGAATVSDGGSWAIAGGLGMGGTLAVSAGTVSVANFLHIGSQTGASAVVTVASGVLTTPSGFADGESGTTAINVGSGGTLVFGGTYNPVGESAGANGSLTITSGGTVESIQAAEDATILEVGNSGATSNATAASGTVVVTGIGALLNLAGNGLAVGNQGIGQLIVSQSATVDAGALNSNLSSALQAGFATGSEGQIVVTGRNSVLNLGGYTGLGQGGSANLTVSDDGFVNITNSPTNAGGLGIGVGFSGSANNTGGNGKATVTSGGTLSSQNGFQVGGNGVSGVLNVNTGGMVETGAGFTVGTATQVNGTIYGSTGSVNIGTGGTVLVTEAPQTTNYGVVIGNANSSVGGATSLATGAVTVSGDGAVLNANTNGIAVGLYSDGFLTIGQGARVESGTLNSSDISALSIGRQGDGQVIVNAGTLLADGDVYVGRTGTGRLLVENGGSVNVGLDGTGSASSGALQIGGAGYAGGTLLYVGGTGSMQVESGGTVTSQLYIEVGYDGTNGDLSITDGLVESSQRILIGNSTTALVGDTIISPSGTTTVTVSTLETGDGSVDIGPGGTLESTSVTLTGSNGSSGIVIGTGAGASSTVAVHGAGALLSSGVNRLGVGSASEGTLVISQGGSVAAESSAVGNEAMYIGAATNAPGAVTVTDRGSVLTALGQLDVGLGGAGSLLIENQASVFTGSDVNDPTQGFDVGTDAGADGEVTVTGSKSLLSNTGLFVVGDGGLGALSIQSSGTVITTPGTVAGLAGAMIANQSGASGSSVNVTGTGSDWQIAGALDIGDAGAGALAVTNNATVSAGSLDVGIQNTGSTEGTGQISLSGTASSLDISGDATIGDAGSASLSILNGATLNAADLTIGAQGTGSGAVLVSDAGSLLNLTGTLYVGTTEGVGELTIGPNATIVAGRVILQGEVVNEGGLLDPNEIDVTPGNPIVGYGGVGGDGDLIVNTGSIEAKAGNKASQKTLRVDGTITGTGELLIDAGSTLATTGPVGSGQSVDFGDATGALVLGDPGDFNGTISSFVTGDRIILDTAVPATFTQSGSVVSVIENGAPVGTLTFAAPLPMGFTTSGALADVPCFLPGTLISTPSGQTKVERLSVGDLVRTASGQVRPVVWIGTGRALATRGRRNAATPVIVRKGALGANVPHADLRVTKGHSLYVDGVLIPVEFLVNHRSILWDDRAQEVSIYHIELDTHDVLLANGAPAESYRDDGNRWLFRNANSGWDQAPKPPCAPVLTGGPVVDAAWRRLLDACGPRPGVPLTDDPDVHLVVDGARVDAMTRTGDVHVFALHAPAGEVRLVSRAGAPQELGIARDPRCLGVAVRRLVVRQGTRFRVVRADDLVLAKGFHEFEAAGLLRWTDGDAVLPVGIFEGFAGVMDVVVHLAGTARYVDDGEGLRALA